MASNAFSDLARGRPVQIPKARRKRPRQAKGPVGAKGGAGPTTPKKSPVRQSPRKVGARGALGPRAPRRPIQARGRVGAKGSLGSTTKQIGPQFLSSSQWRGQGVSSRNRALNNLTNPGRIGELTYRIGKVHYEHPETLLKDARAAKDIALGLVVAPFVIGKTLLTTPKEAPKKTLGLAKAVADDYSARYGELTKDQPDWKKIEAQIRNGATVSYALDAWMGKAALGKLVGGAAKTRVGAKVAPKTHRLVTEPRPLHRVGMGKEGLQAQIRDESRRHAPDYFAARRQGRSDRKDREAATKRQADADSGQPTLRAVEPRGPNEIVPRSQRKANKLARKRVARIRTEANNQFKAMLSEDVPLQKAIKGLTKDEKRALAYVIRGTVNPGDTAASAARLEAMIRGGRKGAKPNLHDSKLASVRGPKFIRESPQAFTPRVLKIAGEVKEAFKRAEAEDPALAHAQAEFRKLQPQGEALGALVHDKPMGRFTTVDHSKRLGALRSEHQVSQKDMKAAETAVAKADDAFQLERASAAKVVSPENQSSGRLNYRQRAAMERLEQSRANVQQALAQAARVAARKEDLLKRIDAEEKAAPTVEQMSARVREAADEAGYPEAGYLPSKEFDGFSFASRAIGGARASHMPRRYTGSLARTGREIDNPDLAIEGLAISHKRASQATMIEKLLDEFADPEISGPKGKYPLELKRAIIERGGRLEDYDLWFPEKAKRAAQDAAKKDVDRPNVLEDTPATQTALIEGLKKGEDLDSLINDASMQNVRGFAIPKEVGGEVRPSVVNNNADSGFTKVGRTYDITKATSGRALFFLNLPWSLANTGTNVMLARLTPADVARAVKTWRAYSPEMKRETRVLMDMNESVTSLYKPHMGASAGKVVQTWNEIRNTVLLGRVRPLSRAVDQWFKLEQKVSNNPFRFARFVKEMRKDKQFRRLDVNVGKANVAIDSLYDIAKLPKDKQLAAWKSREREVNYAAERVRYGLADFASMGRKERSTVGRIMFYTWIRFSVAWVARFAKNRPIQFALTAELARLNSEELYEIFGDDAATTIQIGGQDINLKRFTPAGNILTEFSGPGLAPLLGGVAPPPLTALFEALVLGKDLRRGVTSFNVPGIDWGGPSEPNPRVALTKIVRTAYLARFLHDIAKHGKQYDDSLAIPGLGLEHAKDPNAPRKSLNEILFQLTGLRRPYVPEGKSGASGGGGLEWRPDPTDAGSGGVEWRPDSKSGGSGTIEWKP